METTVSSIWQGEYLVIAVDKKKHYQLPHEIRFRDFFTPKIQYTEFFCESLGDS